MSSNQMTVNSNFAGTPASEGSSNDSWTLASDSGSKPNKPEKNPTSVDPVLGELVINFLAGIPGASVAGANVSTLA